MYIYIEQTYDNWSGKYEEDMQRIGYPGPGNAAKLLRSVSTRKLTTFLWIAVISHFLFFFKHKLNLLLHSSLKSHPMGVTPSLKLCFF